MNQDNVSEFYLVHSVPVKIVSTADGGLDVLALNLRTRQFERNIKYLSVCHKPGADVDELSQEEFDDHVARLQAQGSRPT